MAATVGETMRSINEACKARGGRYAEYSCKVVSWDDVSRGTAGGALSCWGANITDTYLKSKDGTQLFTVRSDNWNEKLGRVDAGEVALVAGNEVPGGGELAPVTLRSFLKAVGDRGAYAGLDRAKDLSDEALDTKCSIRFQTTFLPVTGARGTLEFATEAYNYNTTDDEDPRNLVLLCTTQGVAVQQDGEGAKRLFHHAIDRDGAIHRYWLEAERSDHRVGGPQRETAEEKADALARGKATASVIGTRAMGTRFNVLMTIQVPLQQKKQPEPRGSFLSSWGVMDDSDDCMMLSASFCSAASPMMAPCAAAMMAPCAAAPRMRQKCSSSRPAPRTGTANAARVSRGSEHDVWPGLSVQDPERNVSEHVTITVVIYNTIADGVPSLDDVTAAIDDLEGLYAATGAEGKLADKAFDFMKNELTAKDAQDIATKVTTQPYAPPAAAVAGHDVFPS